MGSSQGNALVELYDSLSILYQSLPAQTDSEWGLALRSVLYGGELLAESAMCYGKQQNERNHSKRTDYQRTRGNGNRITEFSAIQVREPRAQDEEYLPPSAVVPVAPESETALPVAVPAESVDQAILLLAEFPPEPAADRPGDGGDVLLDPARVREAHAKTGGTRSTDETTVLFVSDTHLGYENRENTGSGKKVSWIGDISTQETFEQVAQTAMEQDVDAVVHTGDFLDHEVDAVTLDAVESRLATLSQVGIPVYFIIGSHDHDSAYPQHSGSVNGVKWLKEQVREGRLTELSSSPTPVAGGSLDAYGVSAGNVGIDDIGEFHSREWNPSEIAFGTSSRGPNVLCLHDRLTPYRSGGGADVDLDLLLTQSRVPFDCVLVGDEHRPHDEEFYAGYTFQSSDGTPVLYTGPPARISYAYRDHDPIVTELTFKDELVALKRHTL